MPKHPKTVEGFNGTLEELAKAVGKMEYGSVEEFLEYLRSDIQKQADNDAENDRVILAQALWNAAIGLYQAKAYMGRAWQISKPYMKDAYEE